jgi:hypothetical protein
MDFTEQFTTSSHQHQINHIVGPLRSGASSRPVAIQPLGRANVTWKSRAPLLVAAPAFNMENEMIRLRVRVLRDDDDPRQLDPLTFERYSEANAYLPVYLPPADNPDQFAEPFSVALQVDHRDFAGAWQAISNADISDFVQLRLIEGNTGRITFILSMEKTRIRRQARELRAMRRIENARDHALDRIGADLSVPRFYDHIDYRPPDDETALGEIITVDRREPDPEYRRRLWLYRRVMYPTPDNIRHLLNGAGEPDDPNRGLMRLVGVKDRFDVLETDNTFSIGLHVVTTDSNLFNNFMLYIRHYFLIFPRKPSMHRQRYLSSDKMHDLNSLCVRLNKAFTWESDMGVAPLLASALDQLGLCLRALALEFDWKILQAHNPEGGSRYNLGLGVEMSFPTVEQRQKIRDALKNWEPDGKDDATDSLLAEAQTYIGENDEKINVVDWIWETCGFRTRHQIDDDRWYLSHLPSAGLVIEGNTIADLGKSNPLTAYYHAEGDSQTHALLVKALDETTTAWEDESGDSLKVIDEADAPDLWEKVRDFNEENDAEMILRAAGLPIPDRADRLHESLKRVPAELLATIQLSDDLSNAIIDGNSDVIASLRTLVMILRDARLTSVVPLVTEDNEIILVVAVIGLPTVGINLHHRRSAGFRWYSIPIQGQKADITVTGSRSTITPRQAGISLVVTVAYARHGETDPYEYRVELPEDTRLSLQQYEFLMNLLDHAYPAGVQVNTYSIRQHHVDLDDDGVAEPLPPEIFRTFRTFRRLRHRGEVQSQSE